MTKATELALVVEHAGERYTMFTTLSNHANTVLAGGLASALRMLQDEGWQRMSTICIASGVRAVILWRVKEDMD